MYDRVSTSVRTQGGESDDFPITIGLHQGSTLSPYLFTLILDVLTEKIQEIAPRCMLFADDIVLLGESREELNERLETWRRALETHGFRLSRSKSEYIECKFNKSRRVSNSEVKIGDHIIPQVARFKYLGSVIQDDGEIEGDVNHRIQAGWMKWRKASGVLCDAKVPIKPKGKFYRTAVGPAILYGTECWAVKSQHETKVGVAEMRMLRWMCGKTRQDKIRNGAIRERVGVAPIVEKMVENRLRWFGHVERRPVDSVVRRVDQMERRQTIRGRGRPKKTIREVIKKDLELNDLDRSMVWRVNGQEKILLPATDQSKFYNGDCYIFQYSYPGEDKEGHLIGTWIGKTSVEEERASALSLASKMVESMKFLPSQARIYEGSEPIQFHAILQSCIVFKGGLSDGYKNYIAEKEIPDETYNEDGVALFRIQGTGPDNMQAIQVEPVASSLNSTYCYILHSGPTVFIWSGGLATSDDQELVERMLDLIKPDVQCKPLKEGVESEQFWDLLGGKTEYPSQKITRDAENDPHLFSCNFSEGNLKVKEIHNFSQDDLMTEDIYILDCHSEVFVWVGQQVDSKNRMQALTIGEKFLEHDFLLEALSREAPIYIVKEGSEPPFFTRFFKWESAKSAMLGNSFQRKLAIVKNGGMPLIVKHKRRASATFGGRSSGAPDKSQRSRSMSVSPDRVRVRGRSPAFNALAANFESSNARNLSTPPPMIRKLYPKSVAKDTAQLVPKSSAIAHLTSSFEPFSALENLIPQSQKANSVTPKSNPETSDKEGSMSSRIESLTIQEDVKEGEAEDDEGLPVYPYERVNTASTDPVEDIDVTKREAYLSSAEFQEKFGTAKNEFYKLPKWKQNKLKMAVQLF
ncbi:Villin-4 [Glycine soja]|uniref:Villin-4 n=1 Tax=Glycine soja TaxID=3848 RepID=A0A445G2P2_GLYSO|nr:Villin-4 [Glycine soja]